LVDYEGKTRNDAEGEWEEGVDKYPSKSLAGFFSLAGRKLYHEDDRYMIEKKKKKNLPKIGRI
jgi:hypothetical protein